MTESINQLRQEFCRDISHLSFLEQKQIIKTVNNKLLQIANHYEGTEYLHTLNYLHKIPSKFSKDRGDYMMHLIRNILLLYELKERRNKKKPVLRIVK